MKTENILLILGLFVFGIMLLGSISGLIDSISQEKQLEEFKVLLKNTEPIYTDRGYVSFGEDIKLTEEKDK